MAPRKLKNFLKNLHFFSNFLNFFKLILMHIFEKLLQILGLCPIVKIRSTLEKSDPPNILWTPLNRKIQHKLLEQPRALVCANEVTIAKSVHRRGDRHLIERITQ